MASLTKFFNALSFTKKEDFSDAEYDKDYVPFLINRSLSYYPDSIFFANMMNTRKVDNKNHFRFLLNVLPKCKRKQDFTRSMKDKRLELVSEHYGISYEKAEDYIKILTDEQIEELEIMSSVGGKQ